MADRYRLIWVALAVLGVTLADAASREAAAQTCSAMRKINIGVSVAPPNVVHTSPYVAKELGFFAKRCIEPTIIQFEGGASATASAAAAQGSAIVSVNDVAIGRGMMRTTPLEMVEVFFANVLWAVPFIAATLIYYDLRARKEGYGIAERPEDLM